MENHFIPKKNIILQERFKRALLRWVPYPLTNPEICQWLAGNDQGWILVKQNKKRSVYYFCSSESNKPSLFVKYDHPKQLRDILKSMVRPKVLREYQSSRSLLKNNVPAVEAMAAAWFTSKGFLVTSAIENSTTALAYWQKIFNCHEKRKIFLQALSQFTLSLFAKMVWHPDLHLANILVVDHTSHIDLFIADLHGSRCVNKLSDRKKFLMLRSILDIFFQLHFEEIQEFLGPVADYFKKKETSHLRSTILRLHSNWVKSCWHKRRRKIFENSRLCTKVKTQEGVWLLKGEFDLTMAESAVSAHKNVCFNDEKGLVCNTAVKRISCVAIHGRYFVVQEMVNPGPIIRKSQDGRRWVDNWKIESAGIAIVPITAWLRSKSGDGFLIHQRIRGISLDEEILKNGNKKEYLCALLKELKKLMESLYALDIYFKPLNAKTMIVPNISQSRQPQIFLTDVDPIQFNTKIHDFHREEHFQQFIKFLPIDDQLINQIKPIFVSNQGG